MTSTAQSAIDEMLAAVSYLRVTSGGAADPERVWYRCGDLIEDPDALRTLARSTAAGRGTDDDAVAMSLFVQGYAYRIASTAIGSFVVCGEVLSVDPDHTSFAIGRDRPNAVHLDESRLVRADGDIDVLHRVLIDGHLAGFVDAAHAAVRIGRALLWSNVASSCAASFGAFVDPFATRAEWLASLVDAFFARGRIELARSGRAVRFAGDARWAWERSACCLWYQTSAADGAKCGDCSLWTADERSARYAEQR